MKSPKNKDTISQPNADPMRRRGNRVVRAAALAGLAALGAGALKVGTSQANHSDRPSGAVAQGEASPQNGAAEKLNPDQKAKIDALGKTIVSAGAIVPVDHLDTGDGKKVSTDVYPVTFSNMPDVVDDVSIRINPGDSIEAEQQAQGIDAFRDADGNIVNIQYNQVSSNGEPQPGFMYDATTGVLSSHGFETADAAIEDAQNMASYAEQHIPHK